MLGGGVDGHCGRNCGDGRAELRLRPVAGSLPLVIAATGPRAMRVAARLGAAWVTNWADDQLEHQARLFDLIDTGRVLDRMLEVSSAWRGTPEPAAPFAEPT